MNQYETRNLPRSYGDTKIVVLIRDPLWIFAYWEVSDYKKHEFELNYGIKWSETNPALKVVNITENNFYYINIFDEFTDNWHLKVGSPKTTLFLELGRILPNNLFVSLCRSNTVTTPANAISEDGYEYFTVLCKKRFDDIIYDRIVKELQYGISTPGSRFLK